MIKKCWWIWCDVSSIGYFLEVDIKYPDELHNDYPIAPEKLGVSSDMLSKSCKKVADKYEIKVDDVEKLIPNLGNKTLYVVHSDICSCNCLQEWNWLKFIACQILICPTGWKNISILRKNGNDFD